MDTTYHFSLGLAQGRESKTKTANRWPKRQTLRKISTGISLVSLSLGFSIFGMVIIAHRHQADLNDLWGGGSIATVGGIVSFLVGMVFLVSAYLHWRMSLAGVTFPKMMPTINQLGQALHRPSSRARSWI